MSIRKRVWTTPSGQPREAWVVDYYDQAGERHIETFDRKKDADARHATVKIDVSKGIHVAASGSCTASVVVGIMTAASARPSCMSAPTYPPGRKSVRCSRMRQ